MSLAGRLTLSDRVIAVFSPRRAWARVQFREALARYEAGSLGKGRRGGRDNSDGETQVKRDAVSVRGVARDMERNHDLFRGALHALARNIVGADGISIEPQPRNQNDDIDDDVARELTNLHREWSNRPEVTKTMDWALSQNLACRSWLRDGDQFTQLIEGSVPGYRHASRVPLALELLEADVCPHDYQRDTPNIDAGIERNAWGEPLAFWIYKQHPGNGKGFAALTDAAVKRVPAERMLHLAVRDRLSGLRGISQFASAMTRLDDTKEYEDSERVAARIAANIAAYVKRHQDMAWTPPQGADPNAKREFKLGAGAIFDQLLPGEELELLNPNRPNTGLEAFRQAQLRAAAAGVGLSYSTFARDYNGTYSAQRQELVETWEAYRTLTRVFVAQFVRPIWERFVQLAIASGQLRIPAHIRPETIAQAEFRGPRMPWINPVHEATASRLLVRGGFASAQAVIAERGGRLHDVYEQLARERRLADELELILESDARNSVRSASATSTRTPATSTSQR